MRPQHTLACLVMLQFLMVLAACTGMPVTLSPPPPPTPEVTLSFETIEQLDLGAYGPEHLEYTGVGPRLFVITTQRDIEQLDRLISPPAREQLNAMDFQSYFALALFQGRKPSSGYSVSIQRVTTQGDKVAVYAEFEEPASYTGVRDAETSPYHLVKVIRDSLPIRVTDLFLYSHTVTPAP